MVSDGGAAPVQGKQESGPVRPRTQQVQGLMVGSYGKESLGYRDVFWYKYMVNHILPHLIGIETIKTSI